MLYRQKPFLRLVIPLCAGIISGLYLTPPPFIIFLLLILTMLIMTIPSEDIIRRDIVFGSLLPLALVLCGNLLYSIEKNSITDFKNELTRCVVTISDYPEERQNSLRVKADINCTINSGISLPASGAFLMYLSKESEFADWQPGDVAVIDCIPRKVSNRGNPGEFDYRFYLENHGIKYTVFINDHDVTENYRPDKRNLRHQALIIRNRIIKMYEKSGLKGSDLALVAAITVGDRSMLEQGQKEDFRKAGVMHIMAVSGLHAMILSMFIFRMLFFLKNRLNIVRIFTALLLLWAFTFVAGLTPSVMRAALMFTFLQTGKLLRRPSDPMNSVLASAFVLLVHKPSMLFDAGFMLSYAAVIFIIAFFRDLYLLVRFSNSAADKIWQSMLVTITAQAGTFPLTVMLFNMFPVYFLLTNLIIIPISSLLIITASLIPLFSVIGYVPGVLGYSVKILVWITGYLTHAAASLPGASLEKIGMTVPESIVMTLIAALLFNILIKKGELKIPVLMFLAVIFALLSTARSIYTGTTSEMIIYNIPGETCLAVRTGKNQTVVTGADTIPPAVVNYSGQLGLIVEHVPVTAYPVTISYGNCRILITDRFDGNTLAITDPDILVLSGRYPAVSSDIPSENMPSLVVISSEAAAGYKFHSDALTENLTDIHYTERSGAFILPL